MKKSRIARPIAAVESPAVRSLPLVELLVDTKAELYELMVRSGLRVLDAMLEEDRTALCGPRYAHQPARAASRAGTVPGDVVLGGRKVAVQRPRVRADGREVPLPTFQALAQTDPLNRRVVDQMLVGVATRQYARSLEPVPAGVVRRPRRLGFPRGLSLDSGLSLDFRPPPVETCAHRVRRQVLRVLLSEQSLRAALCLHDRAHLTVQHERVLAVQGPEGSSAFRAFVFFGPFTE